MNDMPQMAQYVYNLYADRVQQLERLEKVRKMESERKKPVMMRLILGLSTPRNSKSQNFTGANVEYDLFTPYRCSTDNFDSFC